MVPIVFALHGDLLYSAVDAKPKRTSDLKRLRNIEASPAVTVLVDHYEEDWSRLWWCRLDGRARVEVTGVGLEHLAEKYAQYREEPPGGPLIVMEVSRWTGWTASSRKEDDG